MTTRTLFTALANAQARPPETPPAPVQFSSAGTDDATLLQALRNSATDRDQIIQRRIGMFTEAASSR